MNSSTLMKTSLGKKVLKPGIIYCADNGKLICLHCAGMSALYTGRDISGQKVEPCAFSETIEWKKEFGKDMACEHGCTSYATVPCIYKGCKCSASHILIENTGRHRETPLCMEHTPDWAKLGTPSEFAVKHGFEYFTAVKL